MVALVVRMRWLLSTVAAGMLLPACFYVDPINERPSADIGRIDPELPGRGDPVDVIAIITDPDGDPTTIGWQAFACGDTNASCDPTPFDVYDSPEFRFTSPTLRADGVTPATRVHVKLDVADSFGATAQSQQVDVNLANAVPTVAVQVDPSGTWHGSYPIGTAARFVAHASDGDDDPATLIFDAPTLFPPPGVPVESGTLTPVDDPLLDPGEAEWELVASEAGNWQVAVTVEDALGASDIAMASMPYALDQAPCIGASDPAFPPTGARIVLDQVRRFSVAAVDDDLDPWPGGDGAFRWYLGPAGGPLTQLDVDGNQVDLDPAHYTPGDQLELRVEAVDRIDRPLCDASMPSCEATPGCFQRQTWTVEAR